MAKNSGDIILRDRMEFDLDANGNRTTVYGRIDLSSYISVKPISVVVVSAISSPNKFLDIYLSEKKV